MNLYNFLLDDAPEYPQSKTILEMADDLDRHYTHIDLQELSKGFGNGLYQELKFLPGEVLAIVSPNDVDIVPIVLAVWRLRGTVTLINPLYTRKEITSQLSDNGASVVVAHPLVIDNVLAVTEELKIPRSRVLLLGNKERQQSCATNWRDLICSYAAPINSPEFFTGTDLHTMPALLPYSSGTTGTPKGVILTHSNLISNLQQCSDTYREHSSWQGGDGRTIPGMPAAPPYDTETGQGGDKILGVLPMFHIYGFMFLALVPIFTGVQAVLCPRFDLLDFGRQISKHQITELFIVPPIALRISRSIESLEKQLGQGWGRSVRFCVCGAAPLAHDLISRLWNDLGWMTVQGYGLTECSPVLTQQHLRHFRDQMGTVGSLVKDVDLKVLRLDDSKSEAAEGEAGEVVVRGPNVFKGYWKRTEETRRCFDSDGWFYTGDVGFWKDGCLTLTGRLKELIKYQGFQVAPAELEDVLLECPIVVDAGVIATYDEHEHTEVPLAFCVREGGLAKVGEEDTKTVIEWVQARLAKYKWLRGGVRWIDTIPKSASGKILRKDLVLLTRSQ